MKRTSPAWPPTPNGVYIDRNGRLFRVLAYNAATDRAAAEWWNGKGRHHVWPHMRPDWWAVQCRRDTGVTVAGIARDHVCGRGCGVTPGERRALPLPPRPARTR